MHCANPDVIIHKQVLTFNVLLNHTFYLIFKTFFKSGIVVMVGWWETMECMVLIL